MRFLILILYAISHTQRFICDFSYFLNKCLIIQHFFKMYAISHTYDVCDFSYTKVCMRFLIHDGWWASFAPQRSAAYPPHPAGAKLSEKRVNTAFCGQSDRQAAAYPPQIAGAGRGKPKCSLLRTARQPICGVPAANRQGGEGPVPTCRSQF